MKNKYTQWIISNVFAAVFCNLSYAALDNPLTEPQRDSLKKIQGFMNKHADKISTKFPYRINLFHQGNVNQNSSGIRISEKAQQLAKDNFSQLFYYQLYNHSMRVPHWHANAIEVGTVLSGKMRVTIWEGKGKKHVFTVNKNNTWMIPQANLHALENVGRDKLTFFVSYNSPTVADRDFITAWAALPDEILARTVGLTVDEISMIRKTTVNRLSALDASAVQESENQPSSFSSNFETIAPIYESSLGSIKRVDSYTNTKMQDMAIQKTIMKPGSLRAPHWYTGGSAMFYVYQGSGFFTMMDDEGVVYEAIIQPGDVISLPVGTFHTYLNTGNEDLVVYEAFRKEDASKEIEEISLLNGTQQFSLGVVQGSIGISKESVAKIMAQKPNDYILAF